MALMAAVVRFRRVAPVLSLRAVARTSARVEPSRVTFVLPRIGSPARLLSTPSQSQAQAARASASEADASRAASAGPGRPRRGPGWDNETLGAACAGVAIVCLGLSYAAVPLYRMFCQATGYGGTVRTGKDGSDVDGRYARLPSDPSALARNRPIRITFNTDMASNLPWRFKPTQPHVTLRAGETALCFFRATNLSDEPIVGVATYNVTPMRAGQYFNKVQCFCFDQQRLLPNETVDMPVFFYVDPDFLDDPNMAGINTLTLSYTFFRADRDAHKLPNYLRELEPGARLHNPAPAAVAT